MLGVSYVCRHMGLHTLSCKIAQAGDKILHFYSYALQESTKILSLPHHQLVTEHDHSLPAWPVMSAAVHHFILLWHLWLLFITSFINGTCDFSSMSSKYEQQQLLPHWSYLAGMDYCCSFSILWHVQKWLCNEGERAGSINVLSVPWECC